MKLINKIKQQKENVFASGENVKIDSIMIDDNGELSSHFYIPDNLHEMRSISKVLIALAYAVKPERVLPKVGVGYVIHISRDGYIFKDGTNGQYLIINFDKNLLISILSSEKEMKYVTEILRDLI